MGPPSNADREQAAALCDELNTQIGALDERLAKLRPALAKYVAEQRRAQAARLQQQVQSAIVERRQLIDMLVAMGHGHPCDHASNT